MGVLGARSVGRHRDEVAGAGMGVSGVMRDAWGSLAPEVAYAIRGPAVRVAWGYGRSPYWSPTGVGRHRVSQGLGSQEPTRNLVPRTSFGVTGPCSCQNEEGP